MKLHIWYNSDRPPVPDRANAGWDEALALWQQLADSGKIECEVTDAASLSVDQRRDGYFATAAIAAALHHYEVSWLFTRGWSFGQQVPALVVYEREKYGPCHVYPHAEGHRLVTIYDALRQLAAELGLEGGGLIGSTFFYGGRKEQPMPLWDPR